MLKIEKYSSTYVNFMKKIEQKVFRNYDPNLHTQEKAVEYTRALNAAKLEKVNTFFMHMQIQFSEVSFCHDALKRFCIFI